MDAQKIKEDFQRDITEFQGGIDIHHGTVIGVLEYACKNKANRLLVLKYLTGKLSSKELTDAEWYALYNMVQPFKPEGGKWQSQRHDQLERMVDAILLAVVDQPGQEKIFASEPSRQGA